MLLGMVIICILSFVFCIQNLISFLKDLVNKLIINFLTIILGGYSI